MKKFIFIFALAIAAVACDTQPDASLPGAEKSGILNIASGDITFTLEVNDGTSTKKHRYQQRNNQYKKRNSKSNKNSLQAH